MGHFQPTSASAGWSGFWLFSAWPSSPWASLKPKQRQLPIQRLILIFFMEAITVLDIIMEATMATLPTESTARGLLRLRLKLPLKLRPRLKPTLGTDTTVDMAMDTTGDMVLDTTVDTTVGTMATPTMESMARGLLKLKLPLRLRPRLKLTPGMDTTVDMVLDTTVDTMATPTTESMVRDLLRLRLLLPPLLRPRLIPGVDTTVATATHTTVMVTAMATTGASKKGTSNAGLTAVPTVFDDDLPYVLTFREKSKCTKQNILLLQTNCI